MATHRSIEQVFPSATWEYRKVKIKAPAAPHRPAPPQGAPSSRLVRRDRRSPLILSICYRGGPEAWYEIKTRSRIWRVPGSVCLHDVLEGINEGIGGEPDERPGWNAKGTAEARS